MEPAAGSMSKLALRDHAEQMLEAIGADLETTQSGGEQEEKSKGQETIPGKEESRKSAASLHGYLRHDSHFSVVQLSAEFRALRATVLRLWLPQVEEMSAETGQQMIRFNEAIDQALAESLKTFAARTAYTRDLFLAVLGHDLRAPLASLLMAARLLEDKQLSINEVPDLGARIRRSAKHMSNMVVDLIDYTRTELGSGMPIALQDVDVREPCAEAVQDAGSAFPERDFRFSASGDLRGSFDRVRLLQLFTNLLSNAAQHGEKGQPVVIDARGEGEAIEVCVTNRGPVIPKESLEAIFMPLVQLPAGAEQDAASTSLGLGLFIAREIAHVHGGEITADSDSVNGTTFTVRLPRQRDPGAEARTAPA
jgi:signal transduction histidine kinase